jgi:nucleoside-diphosphate-sugar epimerase
VPKDSYDDFLSYIWKNTEGDVSRHEKKILVTGGSGYLGTFVRRYFDADDFSRRSGVDICNSEHVRRMTEYEVIIHMAACLDKRVEAESRCFDVNVTGTVNILENLCRDQMLILISTKEVYGRKAANFAAVDEDCSTLFDGHNAYDWSKFLAEKYSEYYTHRSGAGLGIFRLSSCFAPVSSGNKGSFINAFADSVVNGRELVLKSKGAPVRDLLHVTDLCRALELFMASGLRREIFNIGGGLSHTVSLIDLVCLLGELAGKTPCVELLDEPDPGIPRFVTDTGKIERTLGWRPALSLREGLATILA